MNLIKLQIKTKSQNYPILIGNNILGKLKELLKNNLINFNQCLVVIDKNIPKEFINRILFSLPKKELLFIILMREKKIKIKIVQIKFYPFS